MSLAPIYLFCSDDPFLKAQKSKQVVALARQAYPEAQLMLFTSQDFQSGNLAVLENELIDPGLFGGDRIIKIYLDPLNATAIQVLHLLAKRTRPGVTVIVELPRVNATVLKAEAKPYADKITGTTIDTKVKNVVSYIKGVGGVIEVLYPETGNKLKQWIFNLASSYQLAISNSAIELLVDNCEGNLSTIDQLFLLVKSTTNEKQITDNIVNAFLSRDSRYTYFEFANALFSADTNKSLLVLKSLVEETSNVTSTLGLIISNTDAMLNAIAKVKENINQFKGFISYPQKLAFFKPLKIGNPQSMDIVIQTAKTIPLNLYSYISDKLQQASFALKSYDQDKAYALLQDVCVSVSNFTIMKYEDL